MNFLDAVRTFNQSTLVATSTLVRRVDGSVYTEHKSLDRSRIVEHSEPGEDGLGFVPDYNPDVQVGCIQHGLLLGIFARVYLRPIDCRFWCFCQQYFAASVHEKVLLFFC